MIHKGQGTVIVWAYDESDIDQYIETRPKLYKTQQKGNWETSSDSWRTVFVAKENPIKGKVKFDPSAFEKDIGDQALDLLLKIHNGYEQKLDVMSRYAHEVRAILRKANLIP